MKAQVESESTPLPSEIRVYYQADGVVDEVDKLLEEALSKVGYERSGSGYYFVKNERDIAFELNSKQLPQYVLGYWQEKKRVARKHG